MELDWRDTGWGETEEALIIKRKGEANKEESQIFEDRGNVRKCSETEEVGKLEIKLES